MTQSLGWDEIFDAGKSGWDSIVSFLGVAQALAADASVIVDVGCGRGVAAEGRTDRVFQDLRGPGHRVIGIDTDAAAEKNPMIDDFRLIGSDGRWPLDDASVDLAVSDWVLEHVADPQAFVAELTRVLRPGGVLVARTVSRHSLLSITARVVENRNHNRWLRVLQPGRQEQDVFPTCYRMNTERDLHRLLDADFDWTVRHRVGLEQYFLRWPRLARGIMAVEPRLPKAMQMTLVVFARRRGARPGPGR